MKKKFFVNVLVSLLVLFSTCFVGCKSDNTQAKDKNVGAIFSPVANSAVYRYELYGLESFVQEEDKIVWRSSDENVLRVEKGNIMGVSVGSCVLSADYMGTTQTQEITVVQNENSPQILLDDIALVKSSKFNLSPLLAYKGRRIDGAIFEYTTSNASVISLEGNVVTAVADGSAQITVVAKLNQEVVAEKTVECSVNQNEGIHPKVKEFELFITGNVRGEIFKTEEKLEADVFIDGNLISAPNILWTVEDTNIAKLEDGYVKAVAIGSTVVVGEYTDDSGKSIKTVALPVKVEIPVATSVEGIVPDVVVDLEKTEQVLDVAKILGEGVNAGKLRQKDGLFEHNVSNDRLSSKNYKSGEYECVVYDASNSFGVAVNLYAADFVIYNYEDLLEISAPKNLDAYVVLADNIDCGETGYVNKYVEQDGNFTGTFNGLGHTISNFGTIKRIKNGKYELTGGTGLFCHAGNATFKNVAVTDFVISYEYNNAVFFNSGMTNGEIVIDNVYVEVYNDSAKNQFSAGLFALIYRGTIKVNNSIVVMDGAPSTNVGSVVARANSKVLLESFYSIGDFLVASTVANGNNNQYETINNQPNIKFDSKELFIAERNKETTKVDLSGFNDYWDFSKDIPQFKTTV